MSFSKHILVGLLAGIAVGIFLGDHAAVFGFAATAFVKLLQITVLPYMTVSIVRTSDGSTMRKHERSLRRPAPCCSPFGASRFCLRFCFRSRSP